MKKRPFYLALLVTAGLALDHASLRAARPEEPAAIVYQVSGTATATAYGATKPIILFARLPAGAVILTGTDSKVTLAFSKGNRCEVGPGARASLTAKDCVSFYGPVRRLSPVPPLPLVPPTVVDATKEKGYAAVRVRANEIRDLYPHAGTATLANETILRFSVQNDSEHQVKVMDQSGRPIFASTTRSGEEHIPAGILRPGTLYSWTVWTLVPSGQTEAGRGQFTTVSAEAARRRDALRNSLRDSDDSSALALLASIDQGLGLLWEARDELGQALAKDPRDDNLRKALERVAREVPSD